MPLALRLTAAAALCLALSPLAAAQPQLCQEGQAGDFGCRGVDLMARLSLEQMRNNEGGNGNDIWGWTDPQTGREYALMGMSGATAFVDVTTPAVPVFLGTIPTHTVPTTWRDIKVYRDHAFIVSEAPGHGMQVFDLTRLRGMSGEPQVLEPDAHMDTFGNAHNIAINEETGFAYVVGNMEPQGCNGGLYMVDIREPKRPAFAGCFSDASDTDRGYTHDVQCVVYRGPDADYAGREVCFAANENTVTIADVTDKADARMLSQAVYPLTAYTHQGWLTEDHRYFLANDELDESNFGIGTRTLIFDVSDLDSPELAGVYEASIPAIDHNLYVHQGRVYEANYKSGLRVLDLADIEEGRLSEIAYFDTHPESDENTFGGLWSVYPYFPSGTVVVSDMSRGLFVLRPQFAAPEPVLAAANLPNAPTFRGPYYLDASPAAVKLAVSADQDVLLELIDARQGRRVTELYRGPLATGKLLELDVAEADVPDGTYLLRVTGRRFTTQRRISL